MTWTTSNKRGATLNKTLELYQLRTFVAVAEAGHLTHAAERLHLSQPAVSAHIKALEQEFDLRLFERVASGMVLTAAGKQMLDRARGVLKAVDDMRRSAAELNGELIGMLRVGSVSDPKSNRVGELLACAVTRHPKLQLELHHAVSGAALAAVRERELDATFYFRRCARPGVRRHAVAADRLPRGRTHRLGQRVRDADWLRMSELPWVRTPAISTHSQLVTQLFGAHGVRVPPHRIEADDESVIVDLVASGVGVSLVREDVARSRAADLYLWQGEKLRTTLWFVCSATQADEPLLRALLGCVREVWGRV
jgi:DNA-binding transcriptional LysR family regulator